MAGFFKRIGCLNGRDATDFSQILRGDVEIDYNHSGYEDNKTRGWKLTVDFEITYVLLPASPVGDFTKFMMVILDGYKDDPIENHLIPVTIQANPKTSFSKIKIHQTGHGMDANGCGEFCSKYRDVVFNWKSCGPSRSVERMWGQPIVSTSRNLDF